MAVPRTAIILNPRAANGRAEARWTAVAEAVGGALGEYTLLLTERPQHAEVLTAQALGDGHVRIVSVGGDGTHHEVVNGFFRDGVPINPDAEMAIYPMGTGSDLARTLRIPTGPEAVARLASPNTIACDVGCVQATGADGAAAMRYFINSASFGIGGAVAERVNRASKAMGGFASFLWGSVQALFTYDPQQAELVIDGDAMDAVITNVFLANGRYDGGGMLIAPEAALDSGYLEVYVLKRVGVVDGLISLRRLYTGTLAARPDLVHHVRAKRVCAWSDATVPVGLDGELVGYLPAEAWVLPGAIRMVVA